MNKEVIDMTNSTLADRIRLKRVLESHNQPIYISRCNIDGVMLDSLFETDSELVWTKLGYVNSKWQNVNDTFKATISLNDFITKYRLQLGLEK